MCRNSNRSIPQTCVCYLWSVIDHETDNGKEFKNDLFQKMTEEVGLKH